MKSSFLLSFLESVPDVAAKLQEPSTRECKFENVVKSAEQAAVLVLVYIEDLANVNRCACPDSGSPSFQFHNWRARPKREDASGS